MADSAWAPSLAAAVPATDTPRHAAVVRVTHWLTALCFFALLVSGIEILISHPRFYWGEAGNASTQPLFVIPIPASRSTVPTGYGFVLPDQTAGAAISTLKRPGRWYWPACCMRCTACLPGIFEKISSRPGPISGGRRSRDKS